MKKHNFDQVPILLENFDQVIRSSEIRSSDPLSHDSIVIHVLQNPYTTPAIFTTHNAVAGFIFLTRLRKKTLTNSIQSRSNKKMARHVLPVNILRLQG